MLHSIWAQTFGWLMGIGGAVYSAAPRRVYIERRYYAYGILGALACFTYSAALTAIYSTNKPDEFWKFVGLFLGPTLVAIGWVVTNEVNIRNSRKQHTINLIMQYFTNTQRVQDKDKLNKELPYPSVIDGTKHDFDNTSDELLRAAARELNYFDYLSSAVIHRDIDEQLLQRVFGIVIRHYCLQLQPYIEHWRKKDSTYWEDLIALARRWEAAGSILPLNPTPNQLTLTH